VGGRGRGERDLGVAGVERMAFKFEGTMGRKEEEERRETASEGTSSRRRR
jgi:hypothetical protein